MLEAVLRKRAKALALILFLSVFLIATTASAATRFIRADEGGAVRITSGAWLLIPAGSLEEDTLISANMKRTHNYLYFRFNPSGTVFDPDKPAQLCLAWWRLQGLESFVLYGKDGSEVTPEFRWWGVKYDVDHFSLYYFRRR